MPECNRIKDEDKQILKRIFDRIYYMAFYGEIQDEYDIPYEFEAGGEIEEISRKIYNTKLKIAFEVIGECCDPDDYSKLHQLDSLYHKLERLTCYRTFLYGIFVNLYANEDSKELFMNKDSNSIARKMKLISDFVNEREEMEIKRKISKTVLLNTYKEEWMKIREHERWMKEVEKSKIESRNKNNVKEDKYIFSKLFAKIKNFFQLK